MTRRGLSNDLAHEAMSNRVKVQGGKGEDHDTGYILQLDAKRALVAWDSGVRTWTPLSDLDFAR